MQFLQIERQQLTSLQSAIYAIELGLSVHSCFLTREEKEERREHREEKQAMQAYEETILRSPSMIPMTPGPSTGALPAMTPRTPRTLAFNRIDGGSPNLPLRDYNERPPDVLSAAQTPPQTYFPPPPKKETK